MKNFFLVAMLILATSAWAKSAQIGVKGMVCAFCGQGITKTFKKRAEVAKVNVNMDSKIVTLEFNDGKDIPDAEITMILKDAGYDVGKIDRQ